jgi:AraC family transcriptional regulator
MKPSQQHLEHIEKALGFIETQLTRPIRIEEISQHVGYSLYHFCRIFNAVTYISPYTYLMRRRISEAALQVIHTRRRLTDIAVDYGFQSSEVFGRSFKRLFGKLPSELRKEKLLDARLYLPPLQHQQLLSWQELAELHLQKGELAERVLFGLLERSDDCSHATERIWEKVKRQLGHQPMKNCCGIRFYPPDWQKEGIYYFAGFPITNDLPPLPAWFVQKHILTQPALATPHTLAISQVDAALQFLTQVWFPLSSYRADVPFVLEQYEDEPEPRQMRLFLPIVLKDNPSV